jgi:hypothetical protein
MSIEVYREKISELVENTEISKDDVFEYDLSPFSDEFDEIFDFYTETLHINNDYGIEPNIIYFNNHTSINARATKNRDHFVVSMNMGTVVGLINMFKLKSDLLNPEIHLELIELEKSLDVSINILMYQNLIHFTFYHELAHLIQKSSNLEFGLYENIVDQEDYAFTRHVLELDADEYSTFSIGTHLVQYSNKIFGNDITQEQFENLIVINGCSIYLYLKSFKSNVHDIYYFEKTHPHPTIRITSIIFTLIQYCNIYIKEKNIDIEQLEPGKILERILKLSQETSQKVLGRVHIESDYHKTMLAELPKIIDYLIKYREIRDIDKTLSVYQWNEKAKRNYAPQHLASNQALLVYALHWRVC